MNKIFTPSFNGYLVANLVAFLLIGCSKLLASYVAVYNNGVLAFSEFIIIPLLLGIVSAWFWRNLDLSTWQLTGRSLNNAVFAITLSVLFLGEGTICLFIVSPLLLVLIMAGAFAGRAMFRKNNQTLNVSVLSLMVAVFFADAFTPHRYENKVEDEVKINAPISKVWQHVVAFKRIEEKNKYWLFKAGMPSPVQATVDGYYVGANRKCIFSNGYVFDEKIVTYDVNRNLTFDITHQPRDPEIMGHIDILRGQFLLKDNGDNTTTLVGNSWYRLYVFPVWYYDTWAKSITRNVHIRVMEHIKELSESE